MLKTTLFLITLIASPLLHAKSYKQEKSYERRLAKFEKIRQKYPYKTPVICEKAPRTK